MNTQTRAYFSYGSSFSVCLNKLPFPNYFSEIPLELLFSFFTCYCCLDSSFIPLNSRSTQFNTRIIFPFVYWRVQNFNSTPFPHSHFSCLCSVRAFAPIYFFIRKRSETCIPIIIKVKLSQRYIVVFLESGSLLTPLK